MIIVLISIAIIASIAVMSKKKILIKDFTFDVWPFLVTIILSLFVAGVVIFNCVANLNTSGNIEAINAERDILIYQIENKTYINDNNVGTTELFKNISDFNFRVIRNKTGKSNPCISWFYIDAYKYIDVIEIP